MLKERELCEVCGKGIIEFPRCVCQIRTEGTVFFVLTVVFGLAGYLLGVNSQAGPYCYLVSGTTLTLLAAWCFFTDFGNDAP